MIFLDFILVAFVLGSLTLTTGFGILVLITFDMFHDKEGPKQ